MALCQHIISLNVNCLRIPVKHILLRDFISDYDPDIVFLQEVNVDNLDFIGPHYNYVTNIGDNERGTAIIYRAGLPVTVI